MASTPVIDLTAAGDSPPARPAQRPASPSSSSSSSDAPLVARSLTARTDTRNANAAASGSGSGSGNALPARRLPYPTNAASTPIDLTDDDIEYLGEHRLNLPLPHANGNDARPVPGDNYSLMDRLRDVAGMPFSRHARHAGGMASLLDGNLRIINEAPLRTGAAAAGPGPAAVAAANARARRNAAAGGNAATGNGDNNHNAPAGNPPAGLNARRNRQRARNAYNANNFQQPAADPGEYYYRRVSPPPRRAPRGGRRQRRVFDGLLRNRDGVDAPVRVVAEEWDAGDDGDQFDELDFELPHGYDMGGVHGLGAGGEVNRAGEEMAREVGAFRNIMEMLGFHRPNNHNPLANLGFFNAQPANYNHANPPKRKVKAYSVRQSHPNFNKKKDGKDGFERDIVPPPEVEEEAHQQEENTHKTEEAAKLAEPKMDLTSATIVSGASHNKESSADRPTRNKGKGRALELDIPLLNSAAIASASDSNSDIPVLDLAHDSPNGSGSTASSALFSGKVSNSTRGTSVDQLETDEKASLEEVPLPEPAKPTTRTIRAPVCTSCSSPLYLNQASIGRPYILVCGHVICRGCLDAATARYKRWTAEDGESGSGGSNQSKGDASSSTWKGARLKETFQEIDKSRSSTVADTASDTKGKNKSSRLRIGAPGSRTTTTATSSSAATATTRPSARATRAAGRRRGPVPGYAELDDDVPEVPVEEDGSYLPKTARADSGSSSPEVQGHDGTLPDLADVANRKGKGKAVQRDTDTMEDSLGIKAAGTSATTGKRKRNKEDDEGQGNERDDDGKSKTKKQKVEKPSKIDPDWLTCPVRECKGGTDLGKPIGSREGAWELFV